MRFIILIFLMICPVIANAGTIDPSVSDTKYVEYGKQFTYIGKLCGLEQDGSKFCASAVAINDNWIITAAHVINKAESCTFIINDKKFHIEKVICHKDFDSDFGAGDIALGYIKENIGLDFYPDLYQDTDEVNKLCCIAGFGITGTFITGAKHSDGERRAGSNFVDKIYRELLICTASKGESRTSLEFIIASGDSGGGLFIDGKLAGINSCVLAEDREPDSTYTDESGHTRVSTYYSWIIENINEKKK